MSLHSWDYESRTPADDWFRMASAFVDASEALLLAAARKRG